MTLRLQGDGVVFPRGLRVAVRGVGIGDEVLPERGTLQNVRDGGFLGVLEGPPESPVRVREAHAQR